MILGKVIGTLWGARQADGLPGRKLVQVRPVKLNAMIVGKEMRDDPPDDALSDEVVVAVDGLNADEGQLVLVGIGSRVRDITVGRDCPTKAVVVAIVDAAQREI